MSMRPATLRRRAALAFLVPIAIVVACGGSGTPEPATYPPGAVVIESKDRKFDADMLLVPADTAFPLVLVNHDSDKHNIAIRTKAGFEGDIIFRHDPVSNMTITLDVPPIAAGTYYFLCEVHPTMTGTVLSQ